MIYSNKARKSRKSLGFTLIELLVVVLILGILMAVALPLYLSSVKTSGKRVVAGNLKTMANAAQAFKVKSTTQAYPTAAATQITGAGTDIESIGGPNGVTYDVIGTGNDFAIYAKENGSNDVFGTTGKSEVVYYSPVYGKYILGADAAAPAAQTGWATATATDIP